MSKTWLRGHLPSAARFDRRKLDEKINSYPSDKLSSVFTVKYVNVRAPFTPCYKLLVLSNDLGMDSKC
jgi:hypothetical protein